MQSIDYEIVLGKYCDCQAALDLLQQQRRYLELIPSMRRLSESLIAVPLPSIRLRQIPKHNVGNYPLAPIATTSKTIPLPCDLVYIPCDPEWQIKMPGEIVIFIHRPDEELSELLSRWRQVQVLLDNDYEWLMPDSRRHVMCEGSERVYPLFVLFESSPDRIKKALHSASLPIAIVPPIDSYKENEDSQSSNAELTIEN
jgi:hypothetical protein